MYLIKLWLEILKLVEGNIFRYIETNYPKPRIHTGDITIKMQNGDKERIKAAREMKPLKI